MASKKRKRRTRYTLVLFSDSTKKGIKQIYLGARRVRFLQMLGTVLLIAVICYCVYNPILLANLRILNREQAKTIQQLNEEIDSLEAENGALNDKIIVLSETINQKVKSEEEQAKEVAYLSLPTGFPLTGAATIEEQAEQDDEGDDDEEEETLENTKNMMIFAGTSGNMVVASGNGKIVGVEEVYTYDYKITIDHGNGYQSIYWNDGKPQVKVGDTVVRGATLFVIEEENNKLGYQIIQDGVYMNPEEMVEING